MERKKQKRMEFTLIELLVVIIIISLLAGFVAPRLLTRVGKAKKDLARPKMAIIESALERFGLDCGQYPDDSMGLEALLIAPSGLEENIDAGFHVGRNALVIAFAGFFLGLVNVEGVGQLGRGDHVKGQLSEFVHAFHRTGIVCVALQLVEAAAHLLAVIQSLQRETILQRHVTATPAIRGEWLMGGSEKSTARLRSCQGYR